MGQHPMFADGGCCKLKLPENSTPRTTEIISHRFQFRESGRQRAQRGENANQSIIKKEDL
jgi:hypothetical protein